MVVAAVGRLQVNVLQNYVSILFADASEECIALSVVGAVSVLL